MPIKKIRKHWLILLMTGWFLGSMVSFAQEETATETEATVIDKSRLIELYDALLAGEGDREPIEQTIAEERAQIREMIDQEIWASITSPAETENLEDLPDAVDRQRSVITLLQERLNERRVDLALLEQQEDQRFLLPQSETPRSEVLTDESIRLAYADLLARKAILEERITVLEGVLPVQEERLERLQEQQRYQSLQNFLSIGKYLVIILVIIAFQRLVQKFLINRITHLHKRYAITKLFTTALYTVVIIWIITRIFSEHPNIIASFAIIGAGLVVALQDVIKDVVGWLMILQGRFSVGDRISIGTATGSSVTGDVIDIGVLRMTLLEVGTPAPPGGNSHAVRQHTGKTVYISNSMILLNPVTSYHKTSDFLKTEMRLEITFESNWQKAQEILRKILEEETKEFSEMEQKQYRIRTSQFYIASESRGPQVYMDIAGSGIEFTLRFDAPVEGRRRVIGKITAKILERFDASSDIDLAYSTMRIIPTPKGMKNEE